MLINNINFKYGSNEIYNNFNIEFQQGKINCIIGESGCGKTTLFNYISEKLYYENKRIAYVFQEDNLIPWKNIYVNLKIVAKKYFEKSILEKSTNEYADVATEIIITKRIFDGLLIELKELLISKTRDLLVESNKTIKRGLSLTGTIKEWSDGLDPKSFEQLFSDGTDRFLQHIKAVTNDEDLFITRLAKLSTGLRLEDWDSKTIDIYLNALKRFIKTAKDFHSSIVADTINYTSSYQIIFADDEGTSTTRRFDKVEVSARGKLLFNQITASLEAMGRSISEQEKRQILMEVLKKLC